MKMMNFSQFSKIQNTLNSKLQKDKMTDIFNLIKQKKLKQV